jgi:23S rRNA (guanosine2251-2'-O)-methyltransferase
MTERKPPRGRATAKPRAKSAAKPGGGSRKSAVGRPPQGAGDAGIWLYGVHAVRAALANPRRRCLRLLTTAEAGERLAQAMPDGEKSQKSQKSETLAPAIETVARERIERLLAVGAVHQGLALLAEPLPQPAIQEFLAHGRQPGATTEGATGAPTGGGTGETGRRMVVVVLDQVTDPQNTGAVLRSAAAFGAAALITTRRHAPPESGALAKAASGALEHVPYLQVGNLARALDALKAAGFWSLGLSGEATQGLAEADPGGPLVLVLGAEGVGLRRLTAEACDVMARLPTQGPIDTLNVSNAAAVALYELLGRREA